MLKQAFPLLLLLGFPAVALGQTAPLTPQRAPTPEQVARKAAAVKRLQSAEELHRLIASRDALTKKIQQLREITHEYEQVMVSVRACELSLSKARNAEINVECFDPNGLHAHGFAAALSAALFDEPGQTADAKRGPWGSESSSMRVLEDDKILKKVVDELVKAGALKIIAEPTLVFLSGRPASFRVGGEFPISVPQPDGDPKIEYRSFGTELDVVANVLGQGRLQLQLRPRISEIDSTRSVVLGDVTVPGLRVREIETGVEMGSGHTLVVAGLVQQRAVQRAPEELGDADNGKQSGPAPSKTFEDNKEPVQNETEEIEFIVMARAEILEAP